MPLRPIHKLIDAAVATGAGSTHQLPDKSYNGRKAHVQAILAGTATVVLQGSLDGTNWYNMDSFAADEIAEHVLPPYVRGNVTAWTSGAVTLQIQQYGK